LGLDANTTVVDADDPSAERVELHFQAVDAGLDAVESRIGTLVMNNVREDSNQHGEGRDADGRQSWISVTLINRMCTRQWIWHASFRQ
jgi:hypothetical protein